MASKTELVAEWERALRIEGTAILKAADRLTHPSVRAIFTQAIALCSDAIDSGKKIAIFGVGKSGKIAQKIAATLTSTGSPAIALHPTEALHGDLGLIAKGDIALLLSHTGNTEETLRLVEPLRTLGARLIGMGGNPSSKLALACEIWLDASVEQEACPHNFAPTASTTLALAMGDALAVTLMKGRSQGMESLARFHPGGTLGKRATKKVSDLLHSGSALGTVSMDATLPEVVEIATRTKLGGVLVVDGPRLLGLITDGDLRRSLSHREKFFEMRARDVMTSHPITVDPGTLAIEALDRMRNRPSQISVLPVATGDPPLWKGIIRLHDLIQEL